MKFAYTDESGNLDQGDVFVMCALVIDAYKLRRTTAHFDKMLADFFSVCPNLGSGRGKGGGTELKTKAFINGSGNWSNILPEIRKSFVKGLCTSAVECGGKISGIGISICATRKAEESEFDQPFKKNHWLACGMYTCALIQKEMQKIKKGKGQTVVIVDDNKKEMPKISDELHNPSDWYDGLYKLPKKLRGKNTWGKRKDSDRFDQVINTAFAIDSKHSSIIQVVDAICYVYRRHLELQEADAAESWPGERQYYADIVEILEGVRIKLGNRPNESCIKYYKHIMHPAWNA